jgi:Flp pilus assembly protein TadD
MARQAYQIDPLSPVIGSSLAMILYLARKYDQAVTVLQNAHEISPDHFLPHMRTGLVRTQQHKYQDAIQELRIAVRLADQSTETLAALAVAYAASSKTKEAKAIIDELQVGGTRYVLPYNIAKIYAAAADKEKAFEWLEKAYDGGNPDLIELNSEPVFDVVRSDPRFAELMGRIGWKVSDAK